MKKRSARKKGWKGFSCLRHRAGGKSGVKKREKDRSTTDSASYQLRARASKRRCKSPTAGGPGPIAGTTRADTRTELNDNRGGKEEEEPGDKKGRYEMEYKKRNNNKTEDGRGGGIQERKGETQDVN